MSLKDEINKLIPDALKKQIKEVTQKFNQAPIAPPAGQPQPQEPTQLQEATLEDGTVIKYNTPTLAVGSEVTIVSSEGEMPAPAGELKLQDGTVIVVVNADGKSIVESVTPGAPAPVQQEAAVDLNAKILEIANLLKGFETQLAAEKAENESLKKLVVESNTKFSTLEKNVGEFIQVFSAVLETPSAKPIETPKNKKPRPIDAFIAVNLNNK